MDIQLACVRQRGLLYRLYKQEQVLVFHIVSAYVLSKCDLSEGRSEWCLPYLMELKEEFTSAWMISPSYALLPMLKSKSIYGLTKIRLYKTVMCPVMYGSEKWAMKKK
jgi:hypothetical protein